MKSYWDRMMERVCKAKKAEIKAAVEVNIAPGPVDELERAREETFRRWEAAASQIPPAAYEPSNLRAERLATASGGKVPISRQGRTGVGRVIEGVEARLGLKDPERAHTPYPSFVFVCFALGKLLRYYNSVMLGLKPNPTEVTEALDYLVMWELDRNGEWAPDQEMQVKRVERGQGW